MTASPAGVAPSPRPVGGTSLGISGELWVVCTHKQPEKSALAAGRAGGSGDD